MGVGGNFWDLLKPYSRNEGFDFLRNKRVAVDLSFWIVQHETALKKNARNPHLRLTFFRTINLFSKFGVFPVFVVDGVPSPLKARARIERFFRFSGIDLSSFSIAEEGVSVERNSAFTKCVRDCVELLELLGMPVLKARGEAEALCAQLNTEGHVDACITADSDAFLFGARCVIKSIRPNSKEPFECYYMSDIEAGLGLKRKHLVAISLLVGNDHDLKGVPGIGPDTALRFVRMFPEDEVLNRLHEVGNGDKLLFQGDNTSLYDGNIPNSDESSPKIKSSHCSLCGHPGSKRAHLKLPCEFCIVNGDENCMEKPVGFKCDCSTCDMGRKNKEQKKHESWQVKVCKRIAMEQNFPNDEIIEMYLSDNHYNISEENDLPLSWGNPKTEILVDFLAYHQYWEPSYIRQRMLPMLSSVFLRERALNPEKELLLYEQYEFDSIQRVKIRYGHQFYVVNWKRAFPATNIAIHTTITEPDLHQGESIVGNEFIDLLDEPDVPQVFVDDGCWFLSTDENIELVRAAFPEKVEKFLKEKEMKESKSRRKKNSLICDGTRDKSESPNGVQLSITEFYRSTKVLIQGDQGEGTTINKKNGAEEMLKGRRRTASPKLSKSVRRRLLFD